MKIKTSLKTNGFTLVELLIYISGLLILGAVISMLIIQFYSLYKEIVSAPRVDRTGLLIVDRITKEIRSAEQVNMIESSFNNPNGVLSLKSFEDNSIITKKFLVDNSIVKYQKNTDEFLELSSDDFVVSNFNFNYVSNSISEGIRFTMEIQYQVKNATQTKSYSGFAILRESYD